ncbi:hypothetical protein [Reichenbachiella agariperforans]|nr:hypothetical protein [Reichenbachiella agariperforans]
MKNKIPFADQIDCLGLIAHGAPLTPPNTSFVRTDQAVLVLAH